MRVLIVEDDEMLADTLKWVAEEQGDDVTVSYSGKDAIEKAHAHPPDLVVLDMLLPDMEGTEVCRLLRSIGETQHTTIVAHSAFSDSNLRERAKSAGCQKFFVKGVDFRSLVDLFDTLHLRLA